MLLIVYDSLHPESYCKEAVFNLVCSLNIWKLLVCTYVLEQTLRHSQIFTKIRCSQLLSLPLIYRAPSMKGT